MHIFIILGKSRRLFSLLAMKLKSCIVFLVTYGNYITYLISFQCLTVTVNTIIFVYL